MYDMILSHGTEECTSSKERITRFKFFTDSRQRGDAIFGLDRPLMHLVNAFKSAAKGYGTEKRVLLLHGPVGSSKSTIARLLKKGLEEYAAPRPGMLFSYKWKGEGGGENGRVPHARGPAPPRAAGPAATSLDADSTRAEPDEQQDPSRAKCAPSAARCTTTGIAKYDGDWTHDRRGRVTA